jgi:ADP-ribosylglycohydrolase
MRAGPIGLFFSDNPDRLVQAAHDQGRITHQDPRCSAGAIAIAGAVALVLQEEQIEPVSFATQLAVWTRPFDAIVADALQRLPAWVQLPPHTALTEIGQVGVSPNYADSWADSWEGISPFVTGSVLWSLYAFLRSPNDYWEAVCTAIAVGGDVDTTAAMTGAMSGARVGLDGLPPNMARLVNDQGTWQYEQLVQLAHACHALVASR